MFIMIEKKNFLPTISVLYFEFDYNLSLNSVNTSIKLLKDK